MSPIDDELRRTLGGRAAEVAPMANPMAGIESRARRMHRQRQAIGAACAVVVVGSAAVILPQLSRNTSPPAPILTASPNPSGTTSPPPSDSAAVPTGIASPASPALPPVSATPAATAPPSATVAPSPAGEGGALAVYYLGEGTRLVLYREWRKSPAPDRVRAALEIMLAPPLDPNYVTLWPVGTTMRGVTVDGEVATVDLSGEALRGSGGSDAACKSLQQLVWTVTAANPSIKRVAVSVEGRTDGVVSEWWGVGCGADAPMARHSPSYEVLAPVQISTSQESDTVPSRFSFGGEATVFEANVSWSVVDAAGRELAKGFETASKGAPDRGTWQASVVLGGVKRGDVVQLQAWSASAEDGSVTFLDTKNVTIG